MGLFDKTAKRIQEVNRLLKQGKLTPEQYAKKIATLNAKGPDWYVRYTDSFGNEHVEKVPSKRAGQELLAERKTQVRNRHFTAPLLLKTKLPEILDIYLDEKMKGRTSYMNVRAHCKHAVNFLGKRITLAEMDANPWMMKRHYEALPATWTQKQKWNYRTTLRAAIQYFIQTRRLHLLNPIDAVRIEKGTQRRETVPSWEEYQTLLQVARRPRYRDYVHRMLIAGWETGLRIGEILSWRWEGIELEPKEGDLPWVTTQILKQGRPLQKAIPISKALWECLSSMPVPQKESGRVWPIRTYPKKFFGMLFEEAGLEHLRFHDFRRAWKRRHLHLPTKLRMEAQGHKTEAMDDYYLILGRKELEDVVRGSWK